MKAHRTIKNAFRALRRNPMRAMLTTLGIVIGVAAVIAMMEIGKGSSEALKKTIESMGANNIMIFPGSAASGGVTFGGGSTMTLKPQDYEAIVRECSAVKYAAPIVRARTQVIYGGRNWIPANIYGTTPSFLDVRDWELSEGESFSDRDVVNASKVCILGQTLVRELFLGESPVGKELRIKNVTFRVIGVLSAKGANMMGMDQDDIVLAPWTTIKFRVTSSSLSSTSSSPSDAVSTTVNTISKTYPGSSSSSKLYPERSSSQMANDLMFVRFINIDQITVAATSSYDIQNAIDQITAVLRERHRIRSGEFDDFNIRDLAEISNTLSSTSKLMTNLLLCVAMISLVVGGVGIMNIMLVSVTERTREIGLRMAVGAASSDILRQFLIEAIVLCLVGGAIGIAVGHGGSQLVKIFLHWPVASSPLAIAASVLVSAGVGIIFGYYPAWKASKLDPIEALRYE